MKKKILIFCISLLFLSFCFLEIYTYYHVTKQQETKELRYEVIDEVIVNN